MNGKMPIQENTAPRWASSSKSLFVKTVWTEGHRHVVLFESDSSPEYLKFSSKRSSRVASSVSKNSSRASLQTPKNASPISCDFHVSSMKLLLAGIHNLKREPLSNRRYLSKTPISSRKKIEAISIDVIPGNKLNIKNINDDVIIPRDENCNQQNNTTNLLKAVKISLVPNIDDIHYRQECVNNEYPERHYETPYLLTSHCQGVDSNLDDQYNSLSDRVLMWLDLATQNNEDSQKSRYNENFKNTGFEGPYARNRIITAHTCSNLQKQQSYNYHKTLNRSRSYDYYQDSDIYVEEWPRKQDFLYLKTTAIPTFSSLKISNIEDSSVASENKHELNSDAPKLVSRREEPRLTVGFAPENHMKARQRADFYRRQLHIFMPNIPKKSEDCDSNLSNKSKGSSRSSLIKRSSL